MVSADTGALFAAFVPNDPDHAEADAWLAGNKEILISTDYVFDELLTLLKMRGEYQRALHFGASVFNREVIQIEWVLPEDVRRAWEVFRGYQDKAWSFTDCVSRVVMERLGIETAFAFDQHFRQFGTVNVVP